MSTGQSAKETALCGTVVLAVWFSAWLAGFGSAVVQTTAALPVEQRSAALLPADAERRRQTAINRDGQCDCRQRRCGAAEPSRKPRDGGRRHGGSGPAEIVRRGRADRFVAGCGTRTAACANGERRTHPIRCRSTSSRRSRSSKFPTNAWMPASTDICGRFINAPPRRTASRCRSGGR